MNPAKWLWLIVWCAGITGAYAQSDTTRGEVGGTLCFRKMLPPPEGTCQVTFLVQLSNPTVWYPRAATLNSATAELRRRSDTVWQVSATIAPADQVELELCGTVLAGSDSVCVVTLDSLEVCSSVLGRLQQVLIVRSVGPPLPYIRFARLDGPYPSPVARRGSFAVIVRLDARSQVTMYLYDVIGRLHLQREWTFERGVHRQEIQLPESCVPGVYTLVAETASGVESTTFVIE